MAFKTDRERRFELVRTLKGLVIVIFALLTLGTLVYHFSEGWTWLNSLYFATISLTSRGYSSMYPTHWFSIIFSVFYLISGVGIIIYTISTFIGFYTAFYKQSLSKKVDHFIGGFKKKEYRPRSTVLWNPGNNKKKKKY